MSGHPDNAVDEQYSLLIKQEDGGYKRVFTNESLPRVRLEMVLQAQAFEKVGAEVPTFMIEVA